MPDETIMVVERRQELLRTVRDDGRVVASDAAQRFGVSEDSIRRDLRALAAEGLVQRVRGGALPAPATVPFQSRADSSTPAVGLLARAVARRVAEIGGLVVLDSGLTNLRVAEALAGARVTVVTSSPAVGAAASANDIEVIMLGGVVVAAIGASVDATAVHALRSIRADVAVLGACAVDPASGVSTGRADEVAYKQTVVASGAELIVAATVGKLGSTAAFEVAKTSDITTLFTEPVADLGIITRFRDAGVEVLND